MIQLKRQYHIELARWADIVIIAPATASMIAKINAGMADDLITTTCLASSAAIIICPAMNQQMYANIATQENLANLARRGITIWGPASGSQACGDIGAGRMLEPVDITAALINFIQADDGQDEDNIPQLLAGYSLLLTAGPTRESIDPVRYISNHSSGKMGFAIAAAAQAMGAKVTLISELLQHQRMYNVSMLYCL